MTLDLAFKTTLRGCDQSVMSNTLYRLASDETTVFGATLRRFIECTIEAEECDPQVVIRNVRQFLNGIKNYLYVKY
jgi:hypothetical protein